MALAFIWIPSIYFSPTLHNKNTFSQEKSENDFERQADSQTIFCEIEETRNNTSNNFINDLKILLKNMVINLSW